jgi:NADH-quinone oxidoreductase subunit L
MMRLLWLVFFGGFRGTAEQGHHVHESPRSMTVPLMALAVLSVAGGWIGIPAVLGGGTPPFARWLEPVLGHGEHGGGGHGGHGVELGLMGLAVGLAGAGLLAGWWVYRRAGLAERIAAALGPAYAAVRNLYWVDELYDAALLRPFYALCRFARQLDERVVDGVVHGARNVTLGLSHLSNAHDAWVVDGLVNLTGHAFRGASGVLRRVQTGMVQNYAAVMFLGVFLLMVLYTLGR